MGCCDRPRRRERGGGGAAAPAGSPEAAAFTAVRGVLLDTFGRTRAPELLAAAAGVVAAAEANLVPVAAQHCVVQRLMQKSSNVAKDVSATVVRSVGTKCVYKFAMVSLR